MFVLSSDFNSSPYSLDVDKVINSFNDFVTLKEKEVLIQLLGSTVYSQFVAGLALLPLDWIPNNGLGYTTGSQVSYGISTWQSLTTNNLTTPVQGPNWNKLADNKWLKLKNGNTYVIGSNTYTWAGVKSLLIPFIDSQWVEEVVLNIGQLGATIPVAENSVVVSPNLRITRSWNSFAKIAGIVSDYYTTNNDSLYGFCQTNYIDYPDFRFKNLGIKNVFDL